MNCNPCLGWCPRCIRSEQKLMHELGSTSRETIHREKEAFHSRVYEATVNGGEKTENRGGPSTY